MEPGQEERGEAGRRSGSVRLSRASNRSEILGLQPLAWSPDRNSPDANLARSASNSSDTSINAPIALQTEEQVHRSVGEPRGDRYTCMVSKLRPALLLHRSSDPLTVVGRSRNREMDATRASLQNDGEHDYIQLRDAASRSTLCVL